MTLQQNLISDSYVDRNNLDCMQTLEFGPFYSGIATKMGPLQKAVKLIFPYEDLIWDSSFSTSSIMPLRRFSLIILYR